MCTQPHTITPRQLIDRDIDDYVVSSSINRYAMHTRGRE